MSDWTDDWPTVPGYYWTWDGNVMSPGQVIAFGARGDSLGHAVGGALTSRRSWPNLLWGPRIQIPDPPSTRDRNAPGVAEVDGP